MRIVACTVVRVWSYTSYYMNLVAHTVPTVHRIMLVRDFLLPLVIFTLPYMMSLRYFQLSVVTGAQYHFVMSYWYQYKSGKMSRSTEEGAPCGIRAINSGSRT